MNKRKYKYLISYGFTHKVGDKSQYNESGTGRCIFDFDFKIKTADDIGTAESILNKSINIENLTQFSIYSFNLITE